MPPDDFELRERIEDVEFQLSQLRDKVFALSKNDFQGSQVFTKDATFVSGFIQSGNFVTGASGSGWRLTAGGNLEATSGTFRGALAATSGTIAAFTIGSTTITATNLTLTSGAANTANVVVGTGANAGGLNSANASGDIAIWAGSTFANRASAAFNVTAGGAVTASSVTITGGTINVGGVGLIRAYTAGETLLANDACFIETAAQVIELGGFTNDAGASTSWGNTGSQQQVAQRFTGVAGSITRLRIRLKKNNTPTDNAVFTVRQDSETGTSLATVSLAGSSITTSFATYDLDLSATVDLTAATTYSIVFSRSGSLDSTNNYVVERGTTGAASGDITSGQPYYYDGSWASVASSNDFILSIRLTTAAGSVYKTTGGTAATSDGFIGFANANIARAASGNFRLAGIVTGLSSLTTGALYRCDDTPRGGIVTGGTNRKVGIALSATELLITNIW